MRLIVAKVLMEIGFVWLLRGWRPRAVGWWLSRRVNVLAHRLPKQGQRGPGAQSDIGLGMAERDHYHCPQGCEHPQPFIVGELLVCGRCYFKHDDLTPMDPCSPETCGE
jgi:hypothetical protein